MRDCCSAHAAESGPLHPDVSLPLLYRQRQWQRQWWCGLWCWLWWRRIRCSHAGGEQDGLRVCVHRLVSAHCCVLPFVLLGAASMELDRLSAVWLRYAGCRALSLRFDRNWCLHVFLLCFAGDMKQARVHIVPMHVVSLKVTAWLGMCWPLACRSSCLPLLLADVWYVGSSLALLPHRLRCAAACSRFSYLRSWVLGLAADARDVLSLLVCRACASTWPRP